MKQQTTLTKPMLTLVIAALATSPAFLAGCSSTQTKPNTMAVTDDQASSNSDELLIDANPSLVSTPSESINEPLTKDDLATENQTIAELIDSPEPAEIREDNVILEIESAIEEIAKNEIERPDKTTFKFGFDKKELPAEDMEIIAQHGRFLLQHPEKKIQIHGHADAQGAPLYNQHLAKQRAHHVAEILEAQGVASDQIEVISWGSDKPTANGAHWKDHRRVEMLYEDKPYDENIVAQRDAYLEPRESVDAIESSETSHSTTN